MSSLIVDGALHGAVQGITQAPHPRTSCCQRVAHFVKNVLSLIGDLFKILFYGRSQVFYDACQDGHLYTVKLLVRQDDLRKPLFLDSPLSIAARKSQRQIVAFLVAKGADVGSAFITCFPAPGTLQLLQYISPEQLAQLNETYKKEIGSRFMWTAAERSHPALVKALAEKGLNLGEAFGAYFGHNRIQKAFEELVQICRELGKDINALRCWNQPLLCEAASRSKMEPFEFFSRLEGIDFKVADDEGKTPLMHACLARNIEAIDAICLRPEAKDLLAMRDIHGRTALMHAFSVSDFEDVEWLNKLIRLSSDEVLQMKDEDGKNAVHYAIRKDQTLTFRLFPLKKFDEATRESFVLEALRVNRSLASSFVLSGCGVVDGKLSPAIEQAIDALKTPYPNEPDEVFREELRGELQRAASKYSAAEQKSA